MVERFKKKAQCIIDQYDNYRVEEVNQTVSYQYDNYQVEEVNQTVSLEPTGSEGSIGVWEYVKI